MYFNLDAYLTELRGRLDSSFREFLPAEQAADPLYLRAALRQAVLSGGKRLRPSLTIAGCQAVGGAIENALAAACAVEMVHCYSLVHDDLPAMDNSDTRRGRPSCHREYGEAAAILVGDALLTQAFEVLAAEGLRRPAAAPQILQASFELARASGVQGMVGGQALDISLTRQSPSFELLDLCNAGKTAALFTAAVVIGGLCGGANPEQVSKLRAFGFDYGLAFQHIDDLADKEHTAIKDQARERATILSRRSADTATFFGQPGEPLRALAELLQQRVREVSDDEVPIPN